MAVKIGFTIILTLFKLIMGQKDALDYPKVYWRIIDNILHVQCQGLFKSEVSINRAMDISTLLPGQNNSFISNKTEVHLHINLQSTISLQGLYHCNQTLNNIKTGISFILPNHRRGKITSEKEVIRANAGEIIIIQMMKDPNSSNASTIKWRYNGRPMINTNNDPLTLLISRVAIEDAGFYECYSDNIELPHGQTMLIVQECPDNNFGPGCLTPCPNCLNGGICDSLTGLCICPKGFNGIVCEDVCLFTLQGNVCIEDCDTIYQPFDYSNLNKCNIHGFCIKEPFGCSFAPGSIQTLNNLLPGNGKCKFGTYGADCSEICHCEHPRDCDVISGFCKHSCQPGWSGHNCQNRDGYAHLVAVVSIYKYYRVITCSTNSGIPRNIKFGKIKSNMEYVHDEYVTKNSKVILLKRDQNDGLEASYYCEESYKNTKTIVPIRLNANPEGRIETVSVLKGTDVTLKGFETNKENKTSRDYHLKKILHIETSEQYSLGHDNTREHYYVYVTNCPEGKTGVNCSEKVPSCLNDGHYDDTYGCLCQPGFIGRYCEQVCHVPSFISDPTNRHCQKPYNRNSFICLPDPIGCTCFSGTMGFGFCVEDCTIGRFGSNCNHTCHCKNNKCAIGDVFCEDGCEADYEGDLCQVRIERASFMSLEMIFGIAFGCFFLMIAMVGLIIFIICIRRNKNGKKNILRPLTLYIRKSEQWSLYSSYISMMEDNSQYEFNEKPIEKVSTVRREPSTRSLNPSVYYITRESSLINIPDPALQEISYEKSNESGINGIDQSNTLLRTIRWEDVTLENLMGIGHFGEVYKGRMNIGGTVAQIALKTLKGTASDNEWGQFKKEVAIMLKLGHHSNVLPLLGICRHKNRLFIVTEFLHNGDLLTLLRNSRVLDLNPEYSLKMATITFLNHAELMRYAHDVAKGMEYLSSKEILHRDLAARNVLIGENKCAKIADFGLARLGSQYIKIPSNPLPMRWLSLESLESNTYTFKSDVWSYGILLWEIATLGATPYPAMTIHNLLIKLKSGERLKRPKICDRKLYKVMTDCWKECYEERPDFHSILTVFQKILASEKVHLKLKLTEDFEYEPIDFSVEAM